MENVPPLPSVEDVPELFEHGHLWIQELVAGEPLEFRLESTGQVTFTDRDRRLDDVPPSLRASVRHVRERLDRDALLATGEDPSAVTFVGVATRFEGVPYDFQRLPPFLGTDVWSTSRGGLQPPDVVERTFERLGLVPVNALQKEVDATHFDVEGYEIPASNWYDGPAGGVVFRNKRGTRAALRNPTAVIEPEPLPGEPDTLAEAVVTTGRVRRATEQLDESRRKTEPDPVFELVLEAVAREEHLRLPDVEERAFRSAVAERVAELD